MGLGRGMIACVPVQIYSEHVCYQKLLHGEHITRQLAIATQPHAAIAMPARV